MGKHYVCSGNCQGVSPEQKVCEADDCDNQGNELLECECDDNSHPGIVSSCIDCGKLCTKEGGCDMEPHKEQLSS